MYIFQYERDRVIINIHSPETEREIERQGDKGRGKQGKREVERENERHRLKKDLNHLHIKSRNIITKHLWKEKEREFNK